MSSFRTLDLKMVIGISFLNDAYHVMFPEKHLCFKVEQPFISKMIISGETSFTEIIELLETALNKIGHFPIIIQNEETKELFFKENTAFIILDDKEYSFEELIESLNYSVITDHRGCVIEANPL